MSTQKNLITLCFATVFTFGLAACGGGGGDAPVTGPTQEEIAAATKAAATKVMAIGIEGMQPTGRGDRRRARWQ